MKNPSSLAIALETGATTALVYEAEGAGRRPTLILGHGAGAGQHSAFMVDFARALSRLGVTIVTFNFLYTERRRRIPDRAPALEACFRGAIDAVRRDVAPPPAALFIGGKSMGGRIATQVAAADPDLAIDGLVLLGYPLHPPGRRDERRDRHLPRITARMLFVQGSRDAFGTPGELAPVLDALGTSASLHVVEGGDHSFKLPRRDPAAQAAAYANAQQAIVSWITS